MLTAGAVAGDGISWHWPLQSQVEGL